MKRIHTTMMISLMAVIMMVAAGCKHEYDTVTLGVIIDGSRDAKVYIDDLTPCWHNNDLVRVNNQTCTTSAALGSSAQITNVASNNHYRAIYPADIVGRVNISSSNTVPVTLPRVQQYEVDSRGDQKVKVPMGAYSSYSQRLTFHNLCSLIKVVISSRMNVDFVLDSIGITATNNYLSGQGTATVAGASSDKVELEASSASREVSLVFPTANKPTITTGDRETYVYYIVAPEFEGELLSITLYSPYGQYVTFERGYVSLRHNTMATVSLTVTQLSERELDPPSVDGALPGLFSVSDWQQVQFSQGNLQYQASTNTWRFAEHQYNYVGGGGYGGNVLENGFVCDNSLISNTYTGWIDLFGWGTSGWNSGAVCYQPWSTSISNTDYYPGGSYTNQLTDSYAEADWAWHNPISNGGNVSHRWRTLTLNEWQYLLERDYGSKWGIGLIDSRDVWARGLIILPDNWTLPDGLHFVAGGDSDYDDHNTYSQSQWTQMEIAGAVFLPMSLCFRKGTNLISSEIPGHEIVLDGGACYWASSNGYGLESCADAMQFRRSEIMCWYTNPNRYLGFYVRPVRDIE